jgi:hypothetical protein
VDIRDFSLHQNVQADCSASYNMGTGVLNPAVERPVRDADNAPSSGIQFKSQQKCISVLPVCFHGVEGDTYSVAMVIRPHFV